MKKHTDGQSARAQGTAHARFSGASLSCLVGALALVACSGSSDDGLSPEADAASLRPSSSVTLTASNDATTLSYKLTYPGAPRFLQVYLDPDQNSSTGYLIGGTGADYLVENGRLYRYSGQGGGWGWTFIKQVDFSSANQVATVGLLQSDVGNPSAIDLVGGASGQGRTNKITQNVEQNAGSPTPTPAPTTTPTPAPTTTPTPTPTPTPTGNFTAPTLVNPSSPLKFGAKCDGVTDDRAAFQAAVNAGDVLVPAGTCIINDTVQISVSDRHIECAPGAVLKQTSSTANHVFNYGTGSQTLTGDSIVNCTFVGANTSPPKFYSTPDPRGYNIPVQTQDHVSNFFLAGNTFSNFWGQSMFQTYGSVDGGSGDIVEYNTFKNCGYYGPVFVAHTNGYIGHNTLVDCATGIENDNTAQHSGGNIIEYNTLTVVTGYGAPDMHASAMLTGGVAGGANYSGNIVRNNSVSGKSNGLGFQPAEPSMIWQTAVNGSAQYSNNTCTNGCVVH